MLKLYYSEACPYCQIVLEFLKENPLIEIEMINVLSVSGSREELTRIGGKPMIPALSIDGEIMYESGDILAWLEDKYAKTNDAKH